MAKTLSERIAKIIDEGNACEDSNVVYLLNKMALICEELQAENQALLAKNGELEGWQDVAQIMVKTGEKLHAKIKALEAKVKELEGKGWQPIESAEIGKWVLVATAKIAMKAFVDTKANCGTDLIIIGDDGREYQDFVTHWMPLPELPTKIKGE